MNDDASTVWLCSLPTDPPLAGAPLCDAAETGENLRLAGGFSVPGGQVDIYIGTPPPNG